MKVDYSKYELDESLYGKVTVEDDGAEKTVSVELQPNGSVKKSL